MRIIIVVLLASITLAALLSLALAGCATDTRRLS